MTIENTLNDICTLAALAETELLREALLKAQDDDTLRWRVLDRVANAIESHLRENRPVRARAVAAVFIPFKPYFIA